MTLADVLTARITAMSETQIRDLLAAIPEPKTPNKGRACSVTDCGDKSYCRGYCTRHYQRFRTYGDPLGSHQRAKTTDRFERFIDRTGECWLWTGSVNASGYAMFNADRGNEVAHRYAYETWVGTIPNGHVVTHTCQNRHCVNPNHLRLVQRKRTPTKVAVQPQAPVNPVPCATDPDKFCAPDGERRAKRLARERAAVLLCNTGGPGGRPCPLLAQCEKNIEPGDKWTVRAGLTPADRGHNQEPDRDEKTSEDCGTSWAAANRHAGSGQPLCEACRAFRRAAVAEKRAQGEVAA